MSREDAPAQPRAVIRFWRNYLSVLDKFSVPASARLWYRKHVEDYIAAHPEVRLQYHLPRHVDSYLAAKGGIG
jgi:hypothetical protein